MRGGEWSSEGAAPACAVTPLARAATPPAHSQTSVAIAMRWAVNTNFVWGHSAAGLPPSARFVGPVLLMARMAATRGSAIVTALEPRLTRVV